MKIKSSVKGKSEQGFGILIEFASIELIHRICIAVKRLFWSPAAVFRTMLIQSIQAVCGHRIVVQCL